MNIGKRHFRELESIKAKVRECISSFKKNYAKSNTVQNESRLTSSSTKLVIEELRQSVREEELRKSYTEEEKKDLSIPETKNNNSNPKKEEDSLFKTPSITISRQGINEFVTPFSINQGRALEIFDKWRNSLWFCPNDFKLQKNLVDLKITPYFIPYFLFSTTTQTSKQFFFIIIILFF